MPTQDNKPRNNEPVRSPLFLPPMPPARLPVRQEGVVASDEDTEEELVEQESEPEHKSEFPEAELSAEAEEEIFGLDSEDIMGEGPDDFSDILGVDNERDIMGVDPLKKRSRKLKRTVKRYPSPPPSMGAMQ